MGEIVELLNKKETINVEDGKLLQTPVFPEKILRKKVVLGKYEEHVTTGFYKLDIKELSNLEIAFRKGKKHETTFKLINDEWVFNRSKSGIEIKGVENDTDSLKGIRRMPYIKKDAHEIYLVLDKYSVEIFVDGISLTSSIYPDEKDDLLKITFKGKECVLTKH